MIFKRDLIWNYISLIVMAITGFVMNTVIAFAYGSEIFGIFSETYAWYIILSQLSVWGIHMAIVKFVPEKDSEDDKGSVLKSGLLVVIMISLIVFCVSELVLFLLADFAWKRFMQIAFGGLIFLSINKVLLNYLNALLKMVSYAVFTIVRYTFFGGWIIFLTIIQADPIYLPTVFFLTELVGLVSMLVFFIIKLPMKGCVDRHLIKDMTKFGTAVFPSYMVLEMNTKVDVVCLGFLLKDASQIGIYSFAIFFTEGLYFLFATIRKILNPQLSRANHEARIQEYILELKDKNRKYMIFGGGMAYVCASAGYIILCYLLNRREYVIGIIYILIISFAIVINSKYIVFGDLLAQTGYPLDESAVNVLSVGCNIAINILFIILFETVGAAIATAISHFVFSWYMNKRIKNRLKFSL